jgi:hypothetical protein
MQFLKKSLATFLLLSTCAKVFVSAIDPTTLPFYYSAHSAGCSAIAPGFVDIANEAECSGLATWYQGEFDPNAVYNVESNSGYAIGCIGFEGATLKDPVTFIWNTHPSGNANDNTSYKVCKNSK